MVVANFIKRDRYLDSVLLMSLAAEVKALGGVEEVSVVMGSQANKAVLAQSAMLTAEGELANPTDLVVAIKGEQQALEAALAAVEAGLARGGRALDDDDDGPAPRTLRTAQEHLPAANLALLSIPGPYVRWAGLQALRQGLHLMIFSDNVPLEDEVALKALGQERQLLVMGPDCGTAMLNGVALGFANAVPPGEIGLVGASGTGMQEAMCLLAREGYGLSQAIGVGGRDLSAAVGGSSMIQAIRCLEADPATTLILVISKPPAPQMRQRILDVVGGLRKPYILSFLGSRPTISPRREVYFAQCPEEAALRAISWMRGEAYRPEAFTRSFQAALAVAWDSIDHLTAHQRFVRGLFCGGTLCEEANLVLTPLLGPIWSNVPLDPTVALPDAHVSQGHCLVDMGDDLFTLGRPHPMIDPTQRNERILQEAQDPEVAVLILDFVLGYGAHPDPVGATLPSLDRARQLAREKGHSLEVIATVCGTTGDPQGLSGQIAQLMDHGVVVMPSAAQAARMAALIATRSDRRVLEVASPEPLGVEGKALALRLTREEKKALTALFRADLNVINAGLASFSEAVAAQGARVVHLDWRPPAGGDPELLSMLERLTS